MTRSSCCLISTSHEIGQPPCARVPLFSKVKLKVDKPCPPCTSSAFMKKKETMCIFPTDNGYNNLVVNGSKHERFFLRVHCLGKSFPQIPCFSIKTSKSFNFLTFTFLWYNYDISLHIYAMRVFHHLLRASQSSVEWAQAAWRFIRR